MSLPLHSEGELPGSRDRLNDDVGLLDTAAEQLLLGALNEGLDDGRVPAGVDNTNAQGAAVVLLGGRSLDAGHFGQEVFEKMSLRDAVGIVCRQVWWWWW